MDYNLDVELKTFWINNQSRFPSLFELALKFCQFQHHQDQLNVFFRDLDTSIDHIDLGLQSAILRQQHYYVAILNC